MDTPAPVGELPRPRRADPLATPGGRYRSAMLRRFGVAYWLSGLWFILRRLRLEEHSADNIRKASGRGPLVYAMHTRSMVDWLALNRALNDRRLPLAMFANGLHSTWLRPGLAALREWFIALRQRFGDGGPAAPISSGWLADAVAQGMPTALFLVEPDARPWVSPPAPDSARDPVGALIEAQSRIEAPVQVVPVVVVWRRAPERARGEVARVLLGSADAPGPLQKLWLLATSNRAVLVQAGAPLELHEVIKRTEGGDRARQTRFARIALRRFLYRESRVVRGPRVRSHSWVRRIVLQSPEVRALVADEVALGRKKEEQVRKQVAGVLDQIAARLSFPVVRLANLICSFLFQRIFSGVDIRPEDLERLRASVREGTPVLVPCHRSHLDYLLISWLLYTHDVVLPHIVAGDNLSFFPLGSIFRRGGAFFIRRRFGGDRIFPVVFERYMRQLIRDGFPIEFFLEGGRSRTGKLLPARHGVLGMVLDAASHMPKDREVTFLPIAICYEQIAEEAAYARELGGASKKREDLGQVVKAGGVLRKRFGKVYLRVGEPLPARAVVGPEGESWRSQTRERRREALRATGERLMYRISRSMVVLPTGLVAMGLLCQSRRGIRLTELHARVQRFDALLRRRGAMPAQSLSYGGWAVDEATRRFERDKMLGRLSDEQGDILQVIEDRRITLEYYKNGLIHFVAPVSMLAAAIRAGRAAAVVDTEEMERLFTIQVFLLRYEFTLDPEVGLHTLLQGCVAELVEYGALERGSDGSLRIARADRLGELAGLTRNFLESYALVLRASRAMRSRDLGMRQLPPKVQEMGKGLLAVDELRRPECLSMANLENAVRAFREEGVLQFKSGGGGLQFDDAAWRQYAGDLNRLCS